MLPISTLEPVLADYAMKLWLATEMKQKAELSKKDLMTESVRSASSKRPAPLLFIRYSPFNPFDPFDPFDPHHQIVTA